MYLQATGGLSSHYLFVYGKQLSLQGVIFGSRNAGMGGNLGYSKGALARRGGGWIDAYLPREMRVTIRT